jgi:hypothetical protein
VEQILEYWSTTPNDAETGKFPITAEQVNQAGLPITRGGMYCFNQMELIRETLGLGV